MIAFAALTGLLGWALSSGVLAGLPDDVRIVAAFLVVVFLPGLGWSTAIGVRPPGGGLLGLAWAMPMGVAWMGLLLWARLLVVSNYPRTALAEPVDAPAATDEGGRGAKNAALAEPQVRIALDGRVTRDPFRIDASAFPLPIEESGSRADVEKSIAEPAENQSEIARRLIDRKSVV